MKISLVNFDNVGHILFENGRIMGFYEQFDPYEENEETEKLISQLRTREVVCASSINYPIDIANFCKLTYYRRQIGVAPPPFEQSENEISDFYGVPIGL